MSIHVINQGAISGYCKQNNKTSQAAITLIDSLAYADCWRGKQMTIKEDSKNRVRIDMQGTFNDRADKHTYYNIQVQTGNTTISRDFHLINDKSSSIAPLTRKR